MELPTYCSRRMIRIPAPYSTLTITYNPRQFFSYSPKKWVWAWNTEGQSVHLLFVNFLVFFNRKMIEPLLPVTAVTTLGVERMSKMMGLWTQGMRKCVPSPTTSSFTPLNLSNMTARWPPSTEIKHPWTLIGEKLDIFRCLLKLAIRHFLKRRNFER